LEGVCVGVSFARCKIIGVQHQLLNQEGKVHQHITYDANKQYSEIITYVCGLSLEIYILHEI